MSLAKTLALRSQALRNALSDDFLYGDGANRLGRLVDEWAEQYGTDTTDDARAGSQDAPQSAYGDQPSDVADNT